MLSPTLEKVLILQNRDARRRSLAEQLAAVPEDIKLVEGKISAERTAIEDARTELKRLESQKKLLETDIGSAEDRMERYKSQQMSVRKNDEYQALGHEIDTVAAQISDLEGQELEIMFAIDEAKKRFAEAEAVLQANISGHEERIATLKTREANLQAELKMAEGEEAEARDPLSERVLRLYDRIASRQMPVCVPLNGGKCGGCHLKVSSEVESASRGSARDDELAACDQCGRLVYWES